MRRRVAVLLVLAVGAAGACKTATPRPEPNLALRQEALAQRQLETRRFDTTDEIRLLRAGLIILQDEGFQLDEMESHLGVITASRPAMGVSLVSRRITRDGDRIAVRVTFRRGFAGGRLRDAAVYQEFFARLSKAVSLEAESL